MQGAEFEPQTPQQKKIILVTLTYTILYMLAKPMMYEHHLY